MKLKLVGVTFRPQTFWLYFVLKTTKCYFAMKKIDKDSRDVLMFVCFQFISSVRLSSFAFDWGLNVCSFRGFFRGSDP